MLYVIRMHVHLLYQHFSLRSQANVILVGLYESRSPCYKQSNKLHLNLKAFELTLVRRHQAEKLCLPTGHEPWRFQLHRHRRSVIIWFL